MNIEEQYLELLTNVWEEGQDRENRTGVLTRMIHGAILRHDFKDGFPLLSSKKVNFKSICAELFWMLSGSTDCALLDELNPGSLNIWEANAKEWHDPNSLMPDTYCGYLYGMLLREFGICNGGEFNGQSTDQVAYVINSIINNPESRRILASYWDANAHATTQSVYSCLHPCHLLHQIDVDQQEMKLNMTVYIRSSDLFLGLPFNIPFYALLLQVYSYTVKCMAGVKYEPGTLVVFLHDAHIYHNHFEQVGLQLSRRYDLYKLPKVIVKSKAPMTIESFSNPHSMMGCVQLVDYKYHPYIKADMAV